MPPISLDGLFQEQAPAQRHSATSVEAAKKIEPDANTLRGFVLAYIRGTKDRRRQLTRRFRTRWT